MQQCPYCKKMYNKLTANHFKTHGIEFTQYLKEFEPDKYYFKCISDRIMNLYRPNTSKYIEQVYNTNKRTFEWNTFHSSFNKGHILKHLKREATYGVFPYDKLTYFLVFDIDVMNKDILNSIYRALIELGINDNEQLLSFSGTKGYHVAIFFSECMDKKMIQKLFELVLLKSGFYDSNMRENGQPIIEPRGTNQSGVKLPLSTNYSKFKIEDESDFNIKEEEQKRFCYLVNEKGERIDALEKLQLVKKIERNRIYSILSKYSIKVVKRKPEDEFNEMKKIKISDKNITTNENAIEEIEKTISNIDIGSFSGTADDILNAIKALMDKPIQPGMRNSILLSIAIYYKHIGKSPEENIELLISFSKHKMHKFRTSMEENIAEIEKMVQTIYFSGTAYKYRINVGFKDLWFTKEEIIEILSVSKKNRKLYFAMYAHYKMYGNRSSKIFYMGYETIAKLARLNNKTISEGITELENLKKIIINRRGKMDSSTENHKLPNVYQMIYEVNEDDVSEEDKYYLLSKDGKIDNVVYVNFKMLCSKKFKKEEINIYFKGDKDIVKYKYQSLKRVV